MLLWHRWNCQSHTCRRVRGSRSASSTHHLAHPVLCPWFLPADMLQTLLGSRGLPPKPVTRRRHRGPGSQAARPLAQRIAQGASPCRPQTTQQALARLCCNPEPAVPASQPTPQGHRRKPRGSYHPGPRPGAQAALVGTLCCGTATGGMAGHEHRPLRRGPHHVMQSRPALRQRTIHPEKVSGWPLQCLALHLVLISPQGPISLQAGNSKGAKLVKGSWQRACSPRSSAAVCLRPCTFAGSGYVARSRPGSPTAHLQPVSHTLHSGPQKHAHSSDATHSRLSHDIRPPTPPRLARRAALGPHATDRRPQSPHARHRRSLSAPATRASSPVHSTAFTSPTKHSSRGRSVSPGVGVTQGYQSSHKSPRSIAGLARRATHETYMYPSHSKSLSSPSQAQGVQSFRLGAVLGGHTAGSLGAQGAGRTGAAGGGVNGLANRPVTAPTAGHIGYAGSQLLSPRAEARSRSPGSPHKAEAAQAAPSVQCQDSTIATHGSAAVPQAAPTLQHQDNTIATRGSDVPPPAGATPLSEQLVTGVVSSHPVEEPSDAGTASTSGSDADHTAPQACVQPPAAAVAAAVSTPAQPVGASHSATATVAAAPAHLTVQQPSRMAVATPPVSAAEGAWQRWAAQWQGSRSPAAATAAAAVTANTSPAAAHSQGTPTAAHRGPAAAAMHVNHSPTAATATAAEQRAASPSIRSALSAPAPHSVAAGVHSNTAQSSSAVTAEAAAATAAATAAPAARSLSPIRALRRLFSPQPRHQPDHPTSPHHASETPQSLQGAHAATAHAGNSPQLVGSSVQLSAAVSSAMASGYRPLAPGQYITGRAMLTQHPWHAIQRTSPLHMPRSPHTPHTQPFGAAHVGNGQQGGACDYARGRVVHARSDAGASEGAHAAAPRAARGRSAPPELRAHALESIKEVCSSDSEAGDTPRTSNDTHHIHTTHHDSDPHRGDTQHSGYRSEGGMGQSQRPVRPDRRGVWSPIRPGPEGASRDARAYNASALRTREGLVRGRSASPQGWRPGGTHAHSHSPARSVNQPPLPPVATISSGRSTVRGTTRPGSAGGAAAAPGLWSPQALHGSLHWDARTMPRPGSAGTRAVSRSAHVSPTRSSTPYTTTQ